MVTANDKPSKQTSSFEGILYTVQFENDKWEGQLDML